MVKLTDEHIRLNSYSAVNVRLATQALTISVPGYLRASNNRGGGGAPGAPSPPPIKIYVKNLILTLYLVHRFI